VRSRIVLHPTPGRNQVTRHRMCRSRHGRPSHHRGMIVLLRLHRRTIAQSRTGPSQGTNHHVRKILRPIRNRNTQRRQRRRALRRRRLHNRRRLRKGDARTNNGSGTKSHSHLNKIGGIVSRVT
jgi:hypothetical protein